MRTFAIFGGGGEADYFSSENHAPPPKKKKKKSCLRPSAFKAKIIKLRDVEMMFTDERLIFELEDKMLHMCEILYPFYIVR